MTLAAGAAQRQAGDGAGGLPRVLIVEDHRTVAEALVAVLRAEGIEAEVAESPALGNVVARATEFDPHVVLLDFDLGDDGMAFSLIEPLAARGSAVVMLSGTRDRSVLARCVEMGAVGVLNKAEPVDTVIAAVRATADRGQLMSDAERFEWLAGLRAARAQEQAQRAPFVRLTPRERDVLVRLGEGLSAAEIAERQFVSVFTVRGHIRSILIKLGVNSQLAAVAEARRAGWLE